MTAHAIPALIGAAITVAASLAGLYGVIAAVVAAAACFHVRSLGIFFDINAPRPPGGRSGR